MAADRSFAQAGQSTQGVQAEGLPPPPPLLILLALPHQQLEEDGDEAQLQTQLLPCRRTKQMDRNKAMGQNDRGTIQARGQDMDLDDIIRDRYFLQETGNLECVGEKRFVNFSVFAPRVRMTVYMTTPTALA